MLLVPLINIARYSLFVDYFEALSKRYKMEKEPQKSEKN